MNTSEVAKLLSVSASTIQRWIKQLELPMERNERGHFHFSQGDIELLKNIKEQIQNGILIQDITTTETKINRRGTIKTMHNHHELENLAIKVSDLEVALNAKADSVASYQLLQHRHEIEELQKQIKVLTKQVENLQNQLTKLEKPSQFEQPSFSDQTKKKKKNIVRSIFGF
jgi:chromosome-anchoring protein RacA